MSSYLIVWGGSALIAVVAGSLAAAVTALKLKRSRPPVAELPEATPERDPWTDAEIDCASVEWAEQNGYPAEAAGLMSARLKTLHDIGQGKGWV